MPFISCLPKKIFFEWNGSNRAEFNKEAIYNVIGKIYRKATRSCAIYWG